MVGSEHCLREEVTGGAPITVTDALDQRARFLESKAIRQSDVLKAIFAFVTLEAIKGNLAAVKEYTIATEVLRQPADFDGRASNLVRVHANRLRQRLELYYAGEGAHDPIIIRLPKGSYVPQFSPRPNPPEAIQPVTALVAQVAELTEDTGRRKSPRPRWLLPGALVLAGFVLGLAPSLIYSMRSAPAPVGAIKPDSNLYRFWKPFLARDAPAIIVLGQRRFLLTSKGAYLPFQGPQSAPTGTWIDRLDAISEFSDRKLLDAAGRIQFADSITGLGDAEAAFMLGRTFLNLRAPAAVRKSRLLRIEELRTNNVVFLGAKIGNPLLSSVSDNAQSLCGVSGASLDANSEPAERSERDPKTGALVRDVGRISVLPGLAEGRKTLVLAGDWTFGTLAAARFCTDENCLRELVEFPGFSTAGKFPEYFQAVVSGELVQGELGSVRLVSARAIDCGAR